MPHDVTMPQLGMAQDSGKIVSWLKSPGEAVAKGDALFEVETDKATMEVEAQAAGFLTGVTAAEGDDVPVGQVIARISDTADDDSASAKPASEPVENPGAGAALPDGHTITMPQLGMAQDTGILVSWLKAPGDEVTADDILFEVETDKSMMEVEAGRNGWLAATLAEAGEEVPVGNAVAIISDATPDAPMSRSLKKRTAPAPAAHETSRATSKPKKATPASKTSAASSGSRILASPKARRLALEQGLDLTRLAKDGYPQPYHVADIKVLRALPVEACGRTAEAPRRLIATCALGGFASFASWAQDTHGLAADTVLAGLAGASLDASEPVTVAVERFGATRRFSVPPGRALSAVSETEKTPSLLLRDLRGSRLSSVCIGAEAAPVLTITDEGAGVSITLECAASQLDAGEAIRLLTDFAGRMEQPLRHLL